MTLTEQQHLRSTQHESHAIIDARVVFLTHYIPLYQVRVLQSIARRVRDFQILLSTPIEPNRDFQPDWSGLNVTVQNSWTFRRRWRHRTAGFDDQLYVHFPYDTMSRLRELKPDVVMSLELGARSAGAAMYCRRHPESKLVLCTYMSQRTEQGRGLLRRQLRKQLLKSADAVTYNGPSCREYLSEFGVPSKRLFHLPYAADDRTIYDGPVERDEESSRYRLLVVGQLNERKGVCRLLTQLEDYCRRRSHRQIEVIFAGDGPLRGKLESFAAGDGHDLPNLKVKVLGNVPANDLAVWMLRCGAMIAPTLADEWMLVVNEALHAGVPVIGSIHSQAVTTLIQSGKNGWTYDPMQDGSLALALESYFSESDDAIACMRYTCRQSVDQRTPDWAASGGIRAIQSVLHHQKSPQTETQA
ncbi:Glycosyl transferases group 1 [Rubripirellula amarantea]|uniref:Glycosyl transferases group 1 n=1 Tax=Rubripirellula amarantea TaxID=2527999 RepID=A0A5C5WPL0_9BACT|nr:glycosyltransferase family 4 protein [Rubripirellula amarantea]TWT52507.1 Glycosyl transferases group 1 [Rubripirellula amarantea]